MKKTMRITSLVLAMLIVFSTFAGAVSSSPSDFSDFPNDWSTEAMTFALENGLLEGYGDGTIAPSKEMTRAEMATVLNRAFKAWKEASIDFSDVNESDWFYSEVSKAVAFETFKGMGESVFSPNGNITRAQAFTAIARALKLDAPDHAALDAFSDVGEIPTWAASDLNAMTAAGYIQGYDGALKPNAPLTRAQFAQVMFNIIKHYVTGKVSSLSGNVMIAENDLSINNVTIDGDLIVGANVTRLSLDGVKINGRLLVRDQYDLALNINKSTVKKGLVVYSPNEVTTVYTDTVSALKATVKDYTTTIFVSKGSGMGTGGGSTPPATKYYSVSAAAAEHGSIAVSPALAAAGTTVTVTATPDAGYELDKIYVNGDPISGNTFQALPTNMIVSATFKPIDYQVNVVAPTNGTLVVDKTVANIGDVITVTATPDIGYELVAVKVNGEKLVGNTFVMPADDVTVTAEFNKLPASTYSISIGTVANGTVAVSKNSAQEGEVITVTATPNFGYQLSEILVNGTAITGNTFTMPAENVVVTATFTEKAASTYSINIGATTNGSLTADKTSAAAGETITITATPNTGYNLVAIKVNGKTIAQTGKFVMPAEDVTVTAEFALAYYTVSSSAATNGSFILDKTVAAYGDTVTVTVRPNTGYQLGAVLVNGIAISGNSFEMPADDVTVSVTFTAIDYDVTTVAPANGTLGVSKSVANIGDTITVTTTADAGYALSVIKVNGKALPAGTNTFVMGAEDAEVTAEFYAISYAINVATPAHGNLSVNKTSATIGTEVTVTARPDAGYELSAIKVNGTAITGNTFTMPAEEVTVSAEYVAIDYTITVNAPANGTLVADKATAIVGETVTVTATPADNYKLDFITVNGVAYYTNTFVMPAENVTVGAVFSKLAPNTYSINIGTVVNGTLIVDKYSAVAGDTVTVTATPAAGYVLDKIYVNGTAITGNTFEMPAATVTITADFAAINYNIAVITPTNGSLTADKATAIVGETVTVTATPATGYRLAAVYVNGVAITGDTFKMPAEDVEITAEFTAIAYSVSVVTPANGAIAADKTVAVMGETITITATPNTGYELDEVFVNGTAITGTTFEMPAEDVEVTATFKAVDYTITVIAPANGSVVADKATATVGETVTLSITPNTGYQLSVLKINGNAVLGTTFVMPAEDVEITAEFTAIAYSVSVVTPANGAIAADKTVAAMGETITVTATPNAGYELDEVFVNGTAITGTTFEMPAEDVEVTATFKAVDYTITVIASANGSVVADKATATVGETVTLSITPNTGYQLSVLKINGNAVLGTTFVMPAEDVEITAEFSAIVYTVSSVNPANGSVAVDKSVAVLGETITVTATPNAGYELDEILVNGTAITGNTFEMPAEDVEVTATFKTIDYTITVIAPVNGSVVADKATATVGETINFTAEPATGYRLVEIQVDGSAIPGTSYTMPAKNITVTAVFEAINYRVTVIAPANGSLSANKTTAVYGEEVTVAATPAVGYKLVAVKVNGVAITDGKFTMPAEDVEITAEFELLPPDEYSITIDKIVNGSVSADKTSAIEGETVNLTVVPDKHYNLVEVTVNGVALPEGVFSFEMPAEHVLVSATFEEIPYAIRIDFPDTEYYFLLDTRYDNADKDSVQCIRWKKTAGRLD